VTVRPTCQLVPGGSGPARGASSPPSSEGKLERDRDREGGEGGGGGGGGGCLEKRREATMVAKQGPPVSQWLGCKQHDLDEGSKLRMLGGLV